MSLAFNKGATPHLLPPPPLSLLLLPLLPLPVFVLSSSSFAFSSLAALACYFASSGCSGDPNTISRAQEAVEWAWTDPNTCQRECQTECQNRCRHIECQTVRYNVKAFARKNVRIYVPRIVPADMSETMSE